MGTIEERAQEYAHQYRRDAHDLKGERADAAFAAYCQGAEDERKRLTNWHDIETDKDGFATSESLDAIFDKIPCLVKDSRSGEIELIDTYNASEWRGDMERNPTRYRWRKIHE